MKKIKTLALLFVALLPSLANAHPGHGNHDLFTTNHFSVLFVAIVLALGVTLTIYYRNTIVEKISKKKKSSNGVPR